MRLSRSARGGIPEFSGARELDKCSGSDGAELVQARRAEGTDERHGTLRESDGSRVDGVQFPGTTTVRNAGDVRVPSRPTPGSGT